MKIQYLKGNLKMGFRIIDFLSCPNPLLQKNHGFSFLKLMVFLQDLFVAISIKIKNYIYEILS